MVPFHGVSPDDMLLEYTDMSDRTLLVAPCSEAGRLGLCCRAVGVILCDAQKRVCIRRQGDERSGQRLWNLTAVTHVRFGEAREDAARRVLETGMGIREASLTPFATLAPDDTGEPLHVTLFLARSISGVVDPGRMGEYLFLDEDELNGLVEHMPELLTPTLLWTIRSGKLWKRGTRSRKERPGNGAVLQG